MTHGEFNNLELEEQVALIYSCGTYIADRFEKEFTIVLYRIENFYVELFYHELDIAPIGIKSFIGEEIQNQRKPQKSRLELSV